MYAWGGDLYGRKGDKTRGTDRLAPQEVLGLGGTRYLGDGTNGGPISAIAAGGNHSMALKSDGTRVYAWGSNSNGQVGDNTSGNDRLVPIEVHGLSNTGNLGDGTNGGPISAIAGGYLHSMALKSDGTRVYAWGWNAYGAIGDNTSGNNRVVPIEVHGLSNTGNLGDGTNGGPISEISAGFGHSMALKSDGTRVYAWGYNVTGQIGDNTNEINRVVPQEVLGLSGTGNLGDVTNGGHISAIEAGAYHSGAGKTGGTRGSARGWRAGRGPGTTARGRQRS